MTAWVCGECEAKNPASAEGRFCRSCGSPRNASVNGSRQPERHPEFVPPWEKPGFKDSKPSDACGEPGCTLTVRDHIEEFRAILARPNTLFTRPSRVETMSEHERKVRQQAVDLMRAAALL